MISLIYLVDHVHFARCYFTDHIFIINANIVMGSMPILIGD